LSAEPCILFGSVGHGLSQAIKRTFVGRLLLTYLNGPAPHYAPAIAFNAFVALFPIAVGLVSALVLFGPGGNVTREVDRVILQAFPQGTQGEFARLLRQLPSHAKTVGLISLGAMLYSGSALFSCLGGALNALHGVTGRSVLRQRLVGLRLVGVLGVGIALMVVLEHLADNLPRTPVIGALAAGVPLLLTIGFIYRVAPNRHLPLTQTLPGALLATVLIELVTMAFPLYSRVGNLTSTYGRGLALALLLLTWLYLVSHIVLFGAHLNDTRASPAEQPDPGLVPA
jgi:membrane protein